MNKHTTKKEITFLIINSMKHMFSENGDAKFLLC